jgi:hypothetical protein
MWSRWHVVVPLLCCIQYALCYQTRFTPEHLKTGRDYGRYENTPVLDNGRNDGIQRWGSYGASTVPDPDVLSAASDLDNYQLSDALNYGNPTGENAIVGIALFRNFLRGFKRVVGSLRQVGFDGHIILGVHPLISTEELDYLRKNQVTYYTVNSSVCDSVAHAGGPGGMLMRGKCTSDLPNLKVEWGRFELARRWLRACKACTGWSMIVDVRDIFFQADPVGTISPVVQSVSAEASVH